MDSRLRLLEGLADSPLKLGSPHAASSSHDAIAEDPVLTEARAMLSLEEEELRQLQRKVAAVRGESRGYNRYREVMQQTLKKLNREVAQLRDDLVAAQARAAAASPQVRAAAATGREAQAKRNLQSWIERQEAARTARRVANARGAYPDFSRPSPLRSGAGTGSAAFSLKRQAAVSPKELREENKLLRKRMELLLPEVMAYLAEVESCRAAIAQLQGAVGAEERAGEEARRRGAAEECAERQRQERELHEQEARDLALLEQARRRQHELVEARRGLEAEAAQSSAVSSRLEAELVRVVSVVSVVSRVGGVGRVGRVGETDLARAVQSKGALAHSSPRAAALRSRRPPGCPGLPPGPERRDLASWVTRRGCGGALVPAPSRRCDRLWPSRPGCVQSSTKYTRRPKKRRLLSGPPSVAPLRLRALGGP